MGEVVIVFDNETTGLTKPAAVPLVQQPHIVEFAAVKLNSRLEQVDGISFLCKPPIPIEPDAVKVSGITDEHVKECHPFSYWLPRVTEFFLGERELVAHNLQFDRSLLMFELQRLNRETMFPWPPDHICTVERTMSLKGHRLKLTELYEFAMGRPLDQKHRAMDDVEALADVVRWGRQRGLL